MCSSWRLCFQSWKSENMRRHGNAWGFSQSAWRWNGAPSSAQRKSSTNTAWIFLSFLYPGLKVCEGLSVHFWVTSFPTLLLKLHLMREWKENPQQSYFFFELDAGMGFSRCSGPSLIITLVILLMHVLSSALAERHVVYWNSSNTR